MRDLGPRIEFHSHSIFSDGLLLPGALIREAEIRGHLALAVTDHVDPSNLEEVLRLLLKFEKETAGKLPVTFIPGVELSYIQPQYILEYARRARRLGARIVVVHGESPVEPVYPGTNQAAVLAKGIVDILAHPGMIKEADAALAAENGVFLEITARRGHREGNRHVAEAARKAGARLIVDTDCHSDRDLITQDEAFQLAKDAGLSDEEAVLAIKDNPRELLERSGYR